MSLLQFSGLFVVWLLCTLFIATLTWFEFRRVRFNFNVFFSLLFLLTFFFGFPLTSVLVFRFDVGVAARNLVAGVAFCRLLLRGLLCHLQNPSTQTRC